MYYDIQNSLVLDFCNGWQDLIDRKICMIGSVETRYHEDPVRMLRAVRKGFGKIGFQGKAGMGVETHQIPLNPATSSSPHPAAR